MNPAGDCPAHRLPRLVESGSCPMRIGAVGEGILEVGREPLGVDGAAAVQLDEQRLPVEPLGA